MKLSKKLTAIVFVVAAAAVLLVGCGNSKTAVSPETFYNTMTSFGYTVVDDTASSGGGADAVHIALPPDGSYQIEYVKVPSESVAKSVFDYNVSLFNGSNDGTGTVQQSSGSNYDIYGLKTAGHSMYICRVGGTCVYVDSTALDRDAEIESAITSLGY